MARPARCLWCTEELPLPIRASNPCPSCERINLNEDLRIFRTKRPGPRAVEAALKSVFAVVVGGLYVAMLFGGGLVGLAGVGWSIGLPILVGLIAWDAAGLVTRRRSILRYEVFVPALGIGCFAPFLVFLALGIGIGRNGPIEFALGAAALAAILTVFGLRIANIHRPRARRRGRHDVREVS